MCMSIKPGLWPLSEETFTFSQRHSNVEDGKAGCQSPEFLGQQQHLLDIRACNSYAPANCKLLPASCCCRDMNWRREG